MENLTGNRKHTGKPFCRILSLATVLLLLFSCFPRSISCAENNSRSYLFDLTVNGNHEVTVNPGDIITVTLRLKRTDSKEASLMYAMQDEVNYDESCFRLVENGNLAADDIRTADLGRKDGTRAYYMNFVSVTGGELWETDTMLGMFQLEVIGKYGRTAIESRNYLVSTRDGTDSYRSAANDLSVIIKGDMTVRFVTDGGTPIRDLTVKYGDPIPRPADPEKKGYTFFGWYKDAECTKLWDFETDTVEEDTTLYAKWTEKPLPVAVWIIPVFLLIAIILILLFVLRRKKEK